MKDFPLIRHLILLCLGLACSWPLQAFDRDQIVHFSPAEGSFVLAANGQATPILMATNDALGVARAAGDLQADIERVTGIRPERQEQEHLSSASETAIVIGTIGHSPLIDALIEAGKLDVEAIRGKWEAFTLQVVEDPAPGVERAFVIAGSDRRGTIFGIYEISEQIGVSPWYWWADVPVQPREALYLDPRGLTDEGPVVQYRGIFINDEAPALTGWVAEKFGSFNHQFYAHVFELMLRLRSNYLWPAMWRPQAFFDDDPENGRLAHEYGIVIGTTHHEPLMRAHDEWGRYGEGPWDYTRNEERLRAFWRTGVERSRNWESIISLGMRGDGDYAMTPETNTALLERIVADQREIIAEVKGKDPSEVTQLWALYKEVQYYYEAGMRVPDDVILLWADDNWGNIRRLPTPEERNRVGGAGVYYHFDYVGGPRNYKWINITPLTKIWEQMHLAWQYDANRIWIVNVGDIKPMEFPIDFFLRYAWDPAKWPYERLPEFSESWAAANFPAEHAPEIAVLINGYTKMNRLRSPELMSPDTFSIVHYREAERIEAIWDDYVARAKAVRAALAPEYQDAYFQLVYYPLKASTGLQKLYIAVARNQLYVHQGRVDSNAQAERAKALFAQDRALAEEYHALGDNRWPHMMSQIKFGYTYWQQPEIEAMPPIQYVHPRWGAVMGVAIEGSERSWPYRGVPPAVLPALDYYENGSRWIEVFNRGMEPFAFRIETDQEWLVVSPSQGTITDQTIRLEVEVADWAQVPAGGTDASIRIVGDGGPPRTIRLPVRKPAEAIPDAFEGFVSNGKYVAMEAPHYQRAVAQDGIHWKTLEDFGRSIGGVTTFPVTHDELRPGGESPRLEYDFWTEHAGAVVIELQCAPSLDFQSGEGLRVAVSINDEEPQIIRLDTWQTLQTWEVAVTDNTRKIYSEHALDRPGKHTLKIWAVTPGVVLQRIIIDQGGVQPSYFGPPESPRIGR